MNQEEREKLRAELAKLGVKGEYLDSWQPRQDGWRHRPGLNVEGAEVTPAGTQVPNLPGNPDSTARYAVRGIFPYRPSPSCRCKDCRTRVWEKFIEDSEGHLVPKPKQEAAIVDGHKSYACSKCDWVTPPTSKNAGASLHFHEMHRHDPVKVAPEPVS